MFVPKGKLDCARYPALKAAPIYAKIATISDNREGTTRL